MSIRSTCPHWTPQTPPGSRCSGCAEEQRNRERQARDAEKAAFDKFPLLEKLKKTTYASTNPLFYDAVAHLETLAYPKTYEKLMEFWGEHKFTSGAGFPTDPSYGGWSLQDAQKAVAWVRTEANRLARDKLHAETHGTPAVDISSFSPAFKALVDEVYTPMRAERDERDTLFAANTEEVEKEVVFRSKPLHERRDEWNGRVVPPRKVGPLFEAAVNARIAEKKAEIERQNEEREARRKEEAILAEARRRIEAMEDERKIQAAMANMLSTMK
jgi:hypothetical protein